MSELMETTDAAQLATIEAIESEEVGERQLRWHKQVALSTLVMALLAALGALLAGITANEALLETSKQILQVSYLEGDRVYSETLKAKHEILIALGEAPDPAEARTVVEFEAEMRELEVGAAREAMLASSAGRVHLVFATAVTLLSLGITLGGISVIVEHKLLWVAGILFGAAGAAGVGLGVLTMLS